MVFAFVHFVSPNKSIPVHFSSALRYI
jgi:hypothetical protein